MHFKPFCSLLLFLSLGADADTYNIYETKLLQCVTLEKAKPALTYEDVRAFAPDDIAKHILLLKNIRIQECSNDAEMKALVGELASDEELDKQRLSSRYLSIAISQQLQTFTKEENKRLQAIKELVQGKGLEVDIPLLWEQLKKDQQTKPRDSNAH